MSSPEEQELPPKSNPKWVVESGDDRIAECYLASWNPLTPTVDGLLEQTLRDSPGCMSVLDLGCGADVPITQWVAERRPVTGVDTSTEQLELAGRLVPGATFIHSDRATVEFAEGSFGLASQFAPLSMFHGPSSPTCSARSTAG